MEFGWSKENRLVAEQFVDRNFEKICNRLESERHFFYDEFETVHNAVARHVPSILNERLGFDDDEKVYAVEEIVAGLGCFGMICKPEMLENREQIQEMIKRFYLKQYENLV